MFHTDGTLPPYSGYIFVFGSNLAGRHGAGAALVARELFGAKYGVGVGLTGNSYAIPTKDENIVTLPIYEIAKYIKDFEIFTHQHPELKFWVTAVGCGLAGYKHSEIAPLFRNVNKNCSFPDKWAKYLI